MMNILPPARLILTGQESTKPSAVPTIGTSDIDQANISALAETVAKFESAGFLTVSDEDEAHVRNLIGFPDKSDDTERMPNKKDVIVDEDESKLEADVTAARKLHASITRRLYGNTSRAA